MLNSFKMLLYNYIFVNKFLHFIIIIVIIIIIIMYFKVKYRYLY